MFGVHVPDNVQLAVQAVRVVTVQLPLDEQQDPVGWGSGQEFGVQVSNSECQTLGDRHAA